MIVRVNQDNIDEYENFIRNIQRDFFNILQKGKGKKCLEI